MSVVAGHRYDPDGVGGFGCGRDGGSGVADGVRVQCKCGAETTAPVPSLGTYAKCAVCGRTYLLWPVGEGQAKSAAAAWYLKVGETVLGPFEPSDLRNFVAEGRIAPDTPVRKGTESPWTTAQHVKGLLDAPISKGEKVAKSAKTVRAVPPAAKARTPTASARRAQRPAGLAVRLAQQPGLVAAMGLGVVAIGVLTVLMIRNGKDAKPTSVATAGPTPKTTPKPADAKPVAVKPAEPSPPKAPAVLSTQELVAESAPSVAFIQGRSTSGSGFMVGKRMLATNRHVIEEERIEDVRVQWPDAKGPQRGLYGVTFQYEDPELDLAFLQIDSDLPALPLGAPGGLEKGREIVVIGTPGLGGGQVLPNAVSRGLLGATMQIRGETYYQLDLTVNHGNSGGPVLDGRGQVLGIVTLKATRAEGVGFCLPVDSVRASLDRAGRIAPAERAAMAARHRFRFASIQLLKATQTYVRAARLNVVGMQKAVDAGQDPNKGLVAVERMVAGLVGGIDRDLLDLGCSEGRAAADDAALPSPSRDRLEHLLVHLARARHHVDVPSGTFKSYQTTADSLRDGLNTLVEEFASKEGIQVDDE